MSYSLISRSEIEKSKLNELIVKETAEQLMKDFATFGMDIRFPSDLNFAYQELYDQLVIMVEQLLMENPEKLSAMLYQIDLDEKKIRSTVEDGVLEHELLSDLILERELMKVLTRHYFKNYSR